MFGVMFMWGGGGGSGDWDVFVPYLVIVNEVGRFCSSRGFFQIYFAENNCGIFFINNKIIVYELLKDNIKYNNLKAFISIQINLKQVFSG